jgi:hypothetical protein
MVGDSRANLHPHQRSDVANPFVLTRHSLLLAKPAKPLHFVAGFGFSLMSSERLVAAGGESGGAIQSKAAAFPL